MLTSIQNVMFSIKMCWTVMVITNDCVIFFIKLQYLNLKRATSKGGHGGMAGGGREAGEKVKER